MSRKIMIVEDESVVRNFVKTVLKNRGHQVMAAGSVDEARAMLAREDAKGAVCLVVDVVLDEQSGIAFAEEAVEIRPGAKVLLMSGFTDDVLVANPEHAANFAFLRKPFTQEELVSAVEAVCEGGG